MFNKLFSLECLIEKLLVLLGVLLAILLGIYHPLLVSLLSKAKPEILAQTILITIGIGVLAGLVALIFISFLYSQNNKLKNADEFKFYFGARWRINRAKKTVYGKPFCNCPEHEPIECSLSEYNEDVKFKAYCPARKPFYNYDVIRLREQSGKEISIEEAVKRIKTIEFGEKY